MIMAQLTVDPTTNTIFPESAFGFELSTFTVVVPNVAWSCLYTVQAGVIDAARHCVVSVDEAALMGVEVPAFLLGPGAAWGTQSILAGALAPSNFLVRLSCWRIPFEQPK